MKNFFLVFLSIVATLEFSYILYVHFRPSKKPEFNKIEQTVAQSQNTLKEVIEDTKTVKKEIVEGKKTLTKSMDVTDNLNESLQGQISNIDKADVLVEEIKKNNLDSWVKTESVISSLNDSDIKTLSQKSLDTIQLNDNLIFELKSIHDKIRTQLLEDAEQVQLLKTRLAGGLTSLEKIKNVEEKREKAFNELDSNYETLLKLNQEAEKEYEKLKNRNTFLTVSVIVLSVAAAGLAIGLIVQ